MAKKAKKLRSDDDSEANSEKIKRLSLGKGRPPLIAAKFRDRSIGLKRD